MAGALGGGGCAPTCPLLPPCPHPTLRVHGVRWRLWLGLLLLLLALLQVQGALLDAGLAAGGGAQ